MALTRTPRHVSALVGAITRDYEAAEELELGEAVLINSDGEAALGQANTAAGALARGIVTSVNDPAGGYLAAAGKRVTVTHFGPIAGFSGMTPGADVWLSAATAGAATETQPSGATTWSRQLGYAAETDVLFVMPGVSSPDSNS